MILLGKGEKKSLLPLELTKKASLKKLTVSREKIKK
jgi:hypothetical protein